MSHSDTVYELNAVAVDGLSNRLDIFHYLCSRHHVVTGANRYAPTLLEKMTKWKQPRKSSSFAKTTALTLLRFQTLC